MESERKLHNSAVKMKSSPDRYRFLWQRTEQQRKEGKCSHPNAYEQEYMEKLQYNVLRPGVEEAEGICVCNNKFYCYCAVCNSLEFFIPKLPCLNNFPSACHVYQFSANCIAKLCKCKTSKRVFISSLPKKFIYSARMQIVCKYLAIALRNERVEETQCIWK